MKALLAALCALASLAAQAEDAVRAGYSILIISDRKVDRNHVVQFTFVDFDVEPHQNCSYDYVALYDGANTSAPLIIQVCRETSD